VATPPHIAEAIGKTPIGLGMRLGNGDTCTGAKFHSPSPLVLREVDLVPWDPKAKEIVWLCGTCADNLLVLQHLLEANDGEMDWATRREFGNQVRALGLRGWSIYSGDVKGNG
jgi:hypothetical protein